MGRRTISPLNNESYSISFIVAFEKLCYYSIFSLKIKMKIAYFLKIHLKFLRNTDREIRLEFI